MKKLLLIIVFISLLIGFLYTTKAVPIIIFKSKPISYIQNIRYDSIFSPIDEVSFDSIKKIYIHIANSDLDILPDGIPRRKLLYTEDSIVVKQLINNFTFKYTNSDIATCESCIYIYSNDSLIFESGIVIEPDNIGLQKETFGWIELVRRDEFIDILRKFKPIYQPIIFL